MAVDVVRLFLGELGGQQMAFQAVQYEGFRGKLEAFREKGFVSADNFLMERRLSDSRESSYFRKVQEPNDFQDWEGRHNNDYCDTHLHEPRGGVPETFTDINHNNQNLQLDQGVCLLRLEDLRTPCMDQKVDPRSLVENFEHALGARDSMQVAYVERVLENWNQKRDVRPMFAGFWEEAADLFPEGKHVRPDWANALRDRLGMGHLKPDDGGGPVPVLLLKYTVADVLSVSDAGRKFAIPTVLDSGLHEHFCPTPTDCETGYVLALEALEESGYQLYREIVHSRFSYQLSHCFRVGWIDRAPAVEWRQARKTHESYIGIGNSPEGRN